MQLAGLLDDDLRAGAGGPQRGAKDRPDRVGPGAGAALAQGPDPGGLPEPGAVSRRAGRHRRAEPHPVRQGRARAGRARSGRGRARWCARRTPSPAPVAQRACGVLQADAASAPGSIATGWTCSPPPRCSAATLTPAKASRRTRRARLALARRRQPTPQRIHSTLRAPLQRFAVQTLQQHLRELRGRHVEDGAVVVLDNASGEVLAWVGSSGALERRRRGRRRAGAAPARLHAQALSVRAGDCRAPPHRRLAAGRLAGADPHRRRPVHPAKLRPPVQGPGVGAHRAGRVAQRAGRAHAGDGVARRLSPAAARRWACR